MYNADYKKIMENLKAIADASKEMLGWIEGGGKIIYPFIANIVNKI